MVAYSHSSSSSTISQYHLEFGMANAPFWGNGKTKLFAEKTHGHKGENQQKTLPTNGITSGIRIRATLARRARVLSPHPYPPCRMSSCVYCAFPFYQSSRGNLRTPLIVTFSIIWKKEISNTRKLRKNSELRVRIKLTTLRVPVRKL